jgi:hypothetical protein
MDFFIEISLKNFRVLESKSNYNRLIKGWKSGFIKALLMGSLNFRLVFVGKYKR